MRLLSLYVKIMKNHMIVVLYVQCVKPSVLMAKKAWPLQNH